MTLIFYIVGVILATMTIFTLGIVILSLFSDAFDDVDDRRFVGCTLIVMGIAWGLLLL